MLFSLLSLFISLAERELTPPLLSAPLKKENSLKNTGREKSLFRLLENPSKMSTTTTEGEEEDKNLLFLFFCSSLYLLPFFYYNQLFFAREAHYGCRRSENKSARGLGPFIRIRLLF
jgi:hypothetical protein